MTNHTFHWQYQKPQRTGPDGGMREQWFLMMDGDEYLLKFARYNGKGCQEGHIEPGQIIPARHRIYRSSLPWQKIRDATNDGESLFALSDRGSGHASFYEICSDVKMPEVIEKELDWIDEMLEGLD